MKNKISIALLLAIMTTILSFNVFAAEVVEENVYDTMLISAAPETDYYDPYATMLISANDTIKVQLDGEYLDFTDENGNVVNPEIINDRTMVPMRKIFEAFDAEIAWDAATRTVVAKTTEKEITLTIDNETAKLKNLETEEEKEIKLDSAPVILNDRTMVPVRFIAESLEKDVAWDSTYRTVVIIDFDKLTKELEEKAPALQKMFELEVDPVESFKSNSEITGELKYTDPEEKTNNEKIEIDGNLELNMNKEKEIEMFFDLEFDGKGTIYDSLKEAGYEELEFGIVVADDSAYMMMKMDGKESWVNMGSELDLSALDTLQLTNNNPKSYAEYIETIKASIGELNSLSYATIKQMIEIYAEMFNEENFTVSGTGSKKTVKLKMDYMELLTGLIPGAAESTEGYKFDISVVEKISNKKVESAKVTLDMIIEEPTTKEKIGLTFELDMKYTNNNKDFDIKLPEISAE